jgi:hypothetical protein
MSSQRKKREEQKKTTACRLFCQNPRPEKKADTTASPTSHLGFFLSV